MVADARGHEVPAGGDAYDGLKALQDLSASINDVVTAASLADAETKRSTMAGLGFDTNGTVWFVQADQCLYLYRASTGFSKVLDEKKRAEDAIPWTLLPLHADAKNYNNDPATAPVYKKSADGVVTITGAVGPANQGAIDGLTSYSNGMTIAVLPDAIRPNKGAGVGGSQHALHQMQQGSGTGIWMTAFDTATNQLKAQRYRDNVPSADTWLPFTVTYQV